jgi:hypothetical protein
VPMRIRTVKPEFFTHEGLFELEKETSLPIRVAFAGLWCAADREGRFKWEPRRLGVQILPYDQVDFSRVLDALTTRGFTRRYRVDEKDFGVIPSFPIHQVINNREKESELPEPCNYLDSDACATREPPVSHAGKAEGKGKEGNKEGKGKEQEQSLPLPFDDPDFIDAWGDWIQHRKEKKKPLTPTSIKLQLQTLKEMGLERAIQAIDHSIEKGWTGIFEPTDAAKPKRVNYDNGLGNKCDVYR